MSQCPKLFGTSALGAADPPPYLRDFKDFSVGSSSAFGGPTLNRSNSFVKRFSGMDSRQMKINQSIKRRSRHSSGGRVPPSGRLLTSPQPDGPHYWGMAFPLDMALLQTTHKLPAVGSGSAEFSTPSMAGNLELASGMVSDAILLFFAFFWLCVCACYIHSKGEGVKLICHIIQKNKRWEGT